MLNRLNRNGIINPLYVDIQPKLDKRTYVGANNTWEGIIIKERVIQRTNFEPLNLSREREYPAIVFINKFPEQTKTETIVLFRNHMLYGNSLKMKV
jgi:vacuolar-type H+-ATPase subunit F/Vma7